MAAGMVATDYSASMRRCVVIGLALGILGCQRTPAPAPAARHVVIVTIDTLRADRLGCYGARGVATPRLDRLAAEGALAVEASAHVPLTRPSHVSLFTGLLPTDHGIRDNVSPAVVPRVPLLAERFRESGFTTAGFVSSVVLESQSGLDRGFGVYSDRFEGQGGDAQFLSTVQRKGAETLGEAVAWLKAQRDERVFLWLHLYEPHDPYEPPEPYASRYAGRPYDGEVAYSDELFGQLDDALASLGMRDETAIVVTSVRNGSRSSARSISRATASTPSIFASGEPTIVLRTIASKFDSMAGIGSAFLSADKNARRAARRAGASALVSCGAIG